MMIVGVGDAYLLQDLSFPFFLKMISNRFLSPFPFFPTNKGNLTLVKEKEKPDEDCDHQDFRF